MKQLMLIVALCLWGISSHAEGSRVLFIGDSITDGNWGNNNRGSASSKRNLWDMNHIYGSGYMYLCAVHYQSEYPFKEYEFFNRGISGNTLNDLEKRWEEDVICLKPDVLSVLIGTNDVNQFLQKDGGTFDWEAWENKYRSLLDRARKENPSLKLVLGAPFVANTGKMRNSSDFGLREELIERCALIVQEIAEDYDAVFLSYNKLFRTLQEKYVVTPESTYWIWDGIHPTPAGHAKMAELWLKKTRVFFK